MIMPPKSNNNKAPSKDSYLPRDFTPGEDDVVIGRSFKYYNHSGNVALRNIVASRLAEYTQAAKSEKSSIISQVTDLITSRSNSGDGFLKLDPSSTYGTRKYQAREHVSQHFRDALGNYRSSSQIKKTRRQTERAITLAETKMRSAKRMHPSVDLPTLRSPNAALTSQHMVAGRDLMPEADSPLSERVLTTLASVLPPNYLTDPNPLEPKHFPELEPLPVTILPVGARDLSSSRQTPFAASEVNGPSIDSFLQCPQQGEGDDQAWISVPPRLYPSRWFGYFDSGFESE